MCLNVSSVSGLVITVAVLVFLDFLLLVDIVANAGGVLTNII